MADNVTDFIDENRSSVLNSSTTLASLNIEKVAGKIAGAVVQPAVWVLDFAANDAPPDGTDVSLWGLSLVSGPVGWAAAATGILKGAVDDRTRHLLEQARAAEPQERRKFMSACADYGWSGQGINAQTIASKGGTAWEHPNGLWVYITDARGLLVCDYRPVVARKIYQPLLPLRPAGRESFRWHVIRGGV